MVSQRVSFGHFHIPSYRQLRAGDRGKQEEIDGSYCPEPSYKQSVFSFPTAEMGLTLMMSLFAGDKTQGKDLIYTPGTLEPRGMNVMF